MSDDVKYLPVEEFQNLGYVQEVNRLFLHPRGLALAVASPWTREAVQKELAEKGIQFGDDAIDCIMTFISATGMTGKTLAGVWDYREDPEGIVFADGLLDDQDSLDKAERVQAEFNVHAEARVALYGSPFQPVGSTPRTETPVSADGDATP